VVVTASLEEVLGVFEKAPNRRERRDWCPNNRGEAEKAASYLRADLQGRGLCHGATCRATGGLTGEKKKSRRSRALA